MWVMLLTPQIACLVVGSPTSSASSCRTATSCSASAGHSRNQSIYVQLIKPAAHQHQAGILSISSSIEFCCSQLHCASLSHQIDDVRVLPCRFVGQQMALMSVFMQAMHRTTNFGIGQVRTRQNCTVIGPNRHWLLEAQYKKADVLAETQRYYQELNAPPPGGKANSISPTNVTDAIHGSEQLFWIPSTWSLMLDRKITNSLTLMTVSGIRLPSSNASGTPSWARPLGQTPNELLRYMPSGKHCQRSRTSGGKACSLPHHTRNGEKVVRPGNMRQRRLKASPAGEMHSMTWRLALTLLRKKLYS